MTYCTKRIPLHQRGGIVAWTMVDEDDFDHLSQFHWHLAGKYAARSERRNGKPVRFLMHREIMDLSEGDPGLVDHINGDALDNRQDNLREVTWAQNGQNKKSFAGSTSKYCGVSWFAPKNQWRVAIMVDGKRTLVGYYDDEEEAGRAAANFYRLHAPYSREASRQGQATAFIGPRADHSDTEQTYSAEAQRQLLALSLEIPQ